MSGAEHSDVFHARLDSKLVQRPVIVERIAVPLVHGHIEKVSSLDEVESRDHEPDFALAREGDRLELFEVAVGPVTAITVGVADCVDVDEVFECARALDLQSNHERLTRSKSMLGWSFVPVERVLFVQAHPGKVRVDDFFRVTA